MLHYMQTLLMFKKIISYLPFSPSLARQTGAYARWLHREEKHRRIGLILSGLMFVVQITLLFFPPGEPTAGRAAAITDQSFPGKQQLLEYCIKNNNFRTVLGRAGIDCRALNSVENTTISSTSPTHWLIWHRTPLVGPHGGERRLDITPQNVVYITPLSSYRGESRRALDGFRSKNNHGRPFVITKDSGALLTADYPAGAKPDCGDTVCAKEITRQSTVLSLNHHTPTQTAQPGERLEFIHTIKNTGTTPLTTDITVPLADTLEYGSLYDYGGGVLDQTNQYISWKHITLQPGEQQSRSYVVQIASQLSTTPRSDYRPHSYDCRIIHYFGETTSSVALPCPPPKQLEQFISQLPSTGRSAGAWATGCLFVLSGLLYLRNRQLDTEVRLIRKDIINGAL